MLENLAFWLVACLVTPLQGPLMHTCACSAPAHCSWLDLLNSESVFFDLFSYFFKWIFEFQSPMICRMLSNQIYFFLNINYLLREPVLQSKCSISELVYLTLFGMGEGIFFIPLDWHFLAEFLSKLFILFWRWKLTLIGLFWQTCPACWAFYKMHLALKTVTFFLENVGVKRVKQMTNLEQQFRDEFVSKNILSCKTARYIFILFSDMLMYIFLLFSRYVELVLCWTEEVLHEKMSKKGMKLGMNL